MVTSAEVGGGGRGGKGAAEARQDPGRVDDDEVCGEATGFTSTCTGVIIDFTGGRVSGYRENSGVDLSSFGGRFFEVDGALRDGWDVTGGARQDVGYDRRLV